MDLLKIFQTDTEAGINKGDNAFQLNAVLSVNPGGVDILKLKYKSDPVMSQFDEQNRRLTQIRGFRGLWRESAQSCNLR